MRAGWVSSRHITGALGLLNHCPFGPAGEEENDYIGFLVLLEGCLGPVNYISYISNYRTIGTYQPSPAEFP
jgi:hypothetical protein